MISFHLQCLTLALSFSLVPSTHAIANSIRDRIREPGLDYDETPNSNALNAKADATTLLQCYEVTTPVLGPSGPVYYPLGPATPPDASTSGDACEVVLMQHDFAYSYSQPFVGTYSPPSCDFDHVILNFTVTSAGVQFDRLALMYLGDIEVWRTSTAEPTSNGIIWTYWKDLTTFLSLWKQEQKIIFDLGNIVDDTWTGIFHTTLTATFFKAPETSTPCTATPADLIIPVTAAQSSANQTSAWNVPNDVAAASVTLPRNIRRAVFSVSANGQSNEEFWWSNVLQSDVDTFAGSVGSFPGYSPWREVQILIDGNLAGVDWPFPVIFTGGVSPTFHRPLVGLQAFDLLEQEIDITAWLPLLCDGNEHTFELKITGFDDSVNGQPNLISPVASYWVLTGKVFVWLDANGEQTTGTITLVSDSGPDISYSSDYSTNTTSNLNQTLDYMVYVQRQLSIQSTINTSAGEEKVSWAQFLSYSNIGNVTAYGNDQLNNMLITGHDSVSRQLTSANGTFAGGNLTMPVETTIAYTYPLEVFLHYVPSDDGSYTIDSTMYQGFNRETTGFPVYSTGIEAFATCGAYLGSAARLSTYRNGTASLSRSSAGKGTSAGEMFQNLEFGSAAMSSGAYLTLFERNVTAIDDSTATDDVKVYGQRRRRVLVGREDVFVEQKPMM